MAVQNYNFAMDRKRRQNRFFLRFGITLFLAFVLIFEKLFRLNTHIDNFISQLNRKL